MHTFVYLPKNNQDTIKSYHFAWEPWIFNAHESCSNTWVMFLEKSYNINSLFYKETETVATLSVMTRSLIHYWFFETFNKRALSEPPPLLWGEVILQSMSAGLGHMKRDWSNFTTLHFNAYICQSTVTDLAIGIFNIIRVFVKIYKCPLWLRWYQHLCCIL